MAGPRDPIADLRRIAFLLERAHEATYRVRAFRTAASVLASRDDLAQRARVGTLTALAGVGEVTARCVTESLAGQQPAYLSRLEAAGDASAVSETVRPEATVLRSALRGDCHTHSDWSDGGSPIEEMAKTARALGHEYLVLTDHSPRLTVANGLSAARVSARHARYVRAPGTVCPSLVHAVPGCCARMLCPDAVPGCCARMLCPDAVPADWRVSAFQGLRSGNE